MAWERYNFTDDYQESIIACLLAQPQEFLGFGQIVKPEFFNGVTATLLVRALTEYYDKYARYPKNFTILGNYAHDRLLRKNPQEAEEMLALCRRLAATNTEDWKSVRDRALNFAKERAALNAVKKIHWHITEGKTDAIDPVKELQEALSVGINYNDIGINLWDDYEETIRRVHGEKGFGILTGFPEFDKVWKTGWHPGWLIAVLAPPKRFKTTFCLNLALNIVNMRSNGADVLYYACEISQELAAMRVIHNLSEQTEEDIIKYGLEKFIQVTAEKIKARMGHHVWFKGFSSKMATMADIRNHARMLKQQCGINPRVIIIDYAETVRPTKVDKNQPEYRSSAQVYTDARAMGNELGCTVIMPDRCNKETVQKRVPNMSSFQGSFEKAGIVDVALGLCGTNAEILQNKIRYFIFLNRHGPQYLHFGGKLDKERFRMTVDEKLDYDETMDDETEAPARGGRRSKSESAATAESYRKLMEEEDRRHNR